MIQYSQRVTSQTKPCLPSIAKLFLIAVLAVFPLQSWAGSIQIEAGKLVFFHKTNQAEFTKDVHLTRDTFELFADRLMAYYSGSELERAEAFGNIRLSQDDVHGIADKAILDQKKNILTLIGHAVLIQKGSRLEGEKIVHDMTQDITTVTPTAGGRTHMTIESEDKKSSILPASGAKK